MKKGLICSIIIIFIFLISSFNIKASTSSDNGKGTYTVDEEIKQSKYGVDYTLAYGTTSSTTYSSDGNQMINLFEMKADGVSKKVVSWAISSKFGYSRSGLSYIAEDYEKNHPGWIVVAGINGDQYYQYFGSDLTATGAFYFVPQPYYPSIMDGERRFASTPTISNFSSNVIGITNDSSSDDRFFFTSTIAGYQVEVLNDNNEVIYTKDIDNFNEKDIYTGTNVFFTYNTTAGRSEYAELVVTPTMTGYLIGDAELSYVSNTRAYGVGSKYDAYFGRGAISEIINNDNRKDISLKQGQFLIDTDDENLINMLEIGKRVRVEAYYEEEIMNQVETAFGFHSIQRLVNKDVERGASSNPNRYNRRIFGIKADGTYTLLTIARGDVNNGTYTGTDHNESNAILKHYGIDWAFQQDGGGSVTAIFRNDNGGFDVVNESSDSNVKQRNIFNGCFFVVRDPEYALYNKNVTRDSITLTKLSNYNNDVIKNMTVTCNNKTTNVDITKDIYIDNLEEDTEYEITLNYNIVDKGKEVPCSAKFKTRTAAYEAPKPGVDITNITGTTISIEQKSKYDFEEMVISIIDENEKVVSEATVDLSKDIYTYTFTNLNKSTSYSVVVNYKIYDELTKTIKDAVESTTVTTLSYNLPTLVKFDVNNIDNNKVKIDVEIFDEDNKAFIAYISYKRISDNVYEKYVLDNLVDTIELDSKLKEDKYEYYITVITTDNEYIDFDKVIIEQDESLNKTKKKGCKKDNMVIFELLSIVSIISYIYKRKKN